MECISKFWRKSFNDIATNVSNVGKSIIVFEMGILVIWCKYCRSSVKLIINFTSNQHKIILNYNENIYIYMRILNRSSYYYNSACKLIFNILHLHHKSTKLILNHNNTNIQTVVQLNSENRFRDKFVLLWFIVKFDK